MELKYQIVMALFVIGCLASIRLGWLLSKNFFERRLNKEMREEAAEYFKKTFYNEFVQKFNEKVEARAFELASIMLEEYKKEIEQDESISGS